MYTLGIETSCDETSAAVLKGRKVLSLVTSSSLSLHRQYGGIIPEIATRNHLKVIDRVVSLSLDKAHIEPSSIDVIGVTIKPGLVGALLVGVNFAKALAMALNKPLLGVNHLHAHLFASFLNNRVRYHFPFIGLVVSGGHTELFLVRDFTDIKAIGKTRDDAAGEVFDKVARAFGLGYPGGVYIDRIYNPEFRGAFTFRCGRIGLDFSFSGIKTALVYKKEELVRKRQFTEEVKVKLLSSFAESVVQTIVRNTVMAAEKFGVKTIVCGGGVLANRRLRQLLHEASRAYKLKIFIPPKQLCTDNGGVVAGLAFYRYNKTRVSDSISITVEPN